MKLKFILAIVLVVPMMSLALGKVKYPHKAKSTRLVASGELNCNMKPTPEEITECASQMTTTAQTNPFTQALLNQISLKLGENYSCGKIKSWKLEYSGNGSEATGEVTCTGAGQEVTVSLTGTGTPITIENVNLWGVDVTSISFKYQSKRQSPKNSVDVVDCNKEVNHSKCINLISGSAQTNPFAQAMKNIIALKLGDKFVCGKIENWELSYLSDGTAQAKGISVCLNPEQTILITLSGAVESNSGIWGINVNSASFNKGSGD